LGGWPSTTHTAGRGRLSSFDAAGWAFSFLVLASPRVGDVRSNHLHGHDHTGATSLYLVLVHKYHFPSSYVEASSNANMNEFSFFFFFLREKNTIKSDYFFFNFIFNVFLTKILKFSMWQIIYYKYRKDENYICNVFFNKDEMWDSFLFIYVLNNFQFIPDHTITRQELLFVNVFQRWFLFLNWKKLHLMLIFFFFFFFLIF
jgi:hypothetical protein